MTADPSKKPLTDLESLQWSHRILVVLPSGGQSVVQELEVQAQAIDERDLIWFVVASPGVVTNYLHPLADDFGETLARQYQKDTGTRQVVLIGKDGGVKQRDEKLDLAGIFRLIDSMPMRQAEMRRRGG